MLFFILVCHCYSYQHHSHLSGYCGLLAQLCLQIIFFIAILEGESSRFEPRPHLEAVRQKYLKEFRDPFSHPQWCSGYKAENLCWNTRSKYLSVKKFLLLLLPFKHLYSIYNLFTFSLNIVNKLTK